MIRVGAVGIRIWKTPPRFPNYSGRRTNFPPHPQFSDTQPGNRDPKCNIPTLLISGIRAVSPSRDKITLPIPAKQPNIDHNSHLGRAQPHREGENVTKRGAVGKRYERDEH